MLRASFIESSLDLQLFVFLAHDLHHPWLDALMVAVTTRAYWWLPLALVAVALLVRHRRLGFAAMIAGGLAVGICDPVVHHLLKPLFGIVKPCGVSGVSSLVPCASVPGFPSAHAANACALATAFVVVLRRYWKIALPLAALVAVSRSYVGVHWPSDVLAGSIFGGGLGVGSAYAVLRLGRWRGWLERDAAPPQAPASNDASSLIEEKAAS